MSWLQRSFTYKRTSGAALNDKPALSFAHPRQGGLTNSPQLEPRKGSKWTANFDSGWMRLTAPPTTALHIPWRIGCRKRLFALEMPRNGCFCSRLWANTTEALLVSKKDLILNEVKEKRKKNGVDQHLYVIRQVISFYGLSRRETQCIRGIFNDFGWPVCRHRHCSILQGELCRVRIHRPVSGIKGTDASSNCATAFSWMVIRRFMRTRSKQWRVFVQTDRSYEGETGQCRYSA